MMVASHSQAPIRMGANCPILDDPSLFRLATSTTDIAIGRHDAAERDQRAADALIRAANADDDGGATFPRWDYVNAWTEAANGPLLDARDGLIDAVLAWFAIDRGEVERACREAVDSGSLDLDRQDAPGFRPVGVVVGDRLFVVAQSESSFLHPVIVKLADVVDIHAADASLNASIEASPPVPGLSTPPSRGLAEDPDAGAEWRGVEDALAELVAAVGENHPGRPDMLSEVVHGVAEYAFENYRMGRFLPKFHSPTPAQARQKRASEAAIDAIDAWIGKATDDEAAAAHGVVARIMQAAGAA